MAAVIVEGGAKLASKQGFFEAGFINQRHQNQQESKQCAVVAYGQGGAGEGHQDAGIDRVANARVRPAADQLVILANGHAGAPEFADVVAGPDGEGNSGGSEQRGRGRDPVRPWNEAQVQRTEIPRIGVEQN